MMRYQALVVFVLGAVLLVGCQQDGLVGPEPNERVDRGDAAVAAGVQNASAAASENAATKESFTAAWDANIVEPGEFRETGEALHLRGQVLTGSVTGDLTGTNTVEFDGDGVIQQEQGNGRGSLTFEVEEINGEPVSGTFEGRFSGQFDGTVFTGRFQAQGVSGDVEGMKIKGTFSDEAADQQFEMSGRILNPNG